jgi:hypothetical protein
VLSQLTGEAVLALVNWRVLSLLSTLVVIYIHSVQCGVYVTQGCICRHCGVTAGCMWRHCGVTKGRICPVESMSLWGCMVAWYQPQHGSLMSPSQAHPMDLHCTALHSIPSSPTATKHKVSCLLLNHSNESKVTTHCVQGALINSKGNGVCCRSLH